MTTESKALSILFVSAQYLPHMGGVEKYTDSLSRALAAQGHHVTILTATPAPEGFESPEGVTVRRMPSVPFLGGRYPLLCHGRAFRACVAALDAASFDAVVINTRFYTLSVWAAGYASRRAIPTLVIEHGSAPLKMGGRIVSAGVRLVERWMTRRLLRYRPHFAGVSRAAAAWLESFGVHAEDVIYNAVDYSAIDACVSEPPEALRTLPGTGDTVLFVGRLTAEKGLPQLMQAVRQLRSERAVTLLVAGEGDLLEQVRQAGDGVLYLGKLPFSQVISTIRAATVFCFPSVHPEGFPTSVLEAAACEACVVSTLAGGTREIVADDSLAYRLPDADPATIAAALRTTLDHPEEAAEKGKRLNAFVRSSFTWARSAQTLAALCQNMIKEVSS